MLISVLRALGLHLDIQAFRNGFDWTGNFGWGSSRFNEQDSKSRTESDAGSFILGTYADKKILGLPTAGPLKIEDVKAAFRLSALKWHPDKHQGSSRLHVKFISSGLGVYFFHLNYVWILPIS
ncbi:UNVERIFIED_CONTAM: hypothetical protein Sangu_1200200 [Sesamum angustifolium]|uniref:J domain-containing protein n=1 Tax=Sesamum angustifolium TaxID=2727405 RepID=A0AAW2NIS4_9LAMI